MKRYILFPIILVISLFFLFLLLNFIFPLRANINYSTIITDDKGEVIHAFLAKDDSWRMKTELDEISPLLKKTIIAKEDKYFYSHPGVNPFAFARAAVKNLFRWKRTSGASTITMQVARSLEKRDRNIWSKIAESFRALQLEWKYSKDEIFQMYLNQVPYGGNIYGVKTASLLYFDKNPDHLSLAEITALSIIPNRPSSLVIGKNNNKIIEQRNHWLKKFADENVFTKKEIEDALAEPLNAVRRSVPKLAPHLSYKLRSSGDIIHTNINMHRQSQAEKLVADYVRVQKLKGIRNASVIIVDNNSGKVISYVGSADFNDTTDAGQVNGANAVRQPGSTLKPLLYAMCIDEGILTPKKILTDVAVNYDGYAPENYDRQFNGYVTVEYALEQSLNIPAVKSLNALGKDRMTNLLSTAGFRQVAKDQKKLGLSMVLGGCGTTLEELTALFTAFAHNGKFKPLSFTADDANQGSKQLFSPASAFMINEILSKVNRPDFPLNWQSTERMPKIAWKTGTSYGRRDAWSIGYNKNYTVGVWVGNFSGAASPDLSGANVATPLLFRIFNTIDYDSDSEWFSQPEDCDYRQVCAETGMIPADHCKQVVMDYFIPLISSTIACNNHSTIMVSADDKTSFCPVCAPESGYKKKSFRMIEPETQLWFDERNMMYAKIPAHNTSCEQVFKEGAPMITSPSNGSEYFISKKHPEPLKLATRTAADVTRLHWYINNEFYKTTSRGETQFFLPKEGPVKISCTDDKGRNRDVWIRVSYVDL